MGSNNELHCKLFRKNISLGLCSEIGAAASRMLRWDAVPEIAEFTRDEVIHACDTCPHVE